MYRELPENNGADWKAITLSLFAGREDAEYFAELASAESEFTSEALTMIAENELVALLKLYEEAEKSAVKSSYYNFYKMALGMMITVLIDQYPEAFEMFDGQSKTAILNMKLETPSMKDLDSQVFAYLDGRVSMPTGTMVTARDFDSWLNSIFVGQNRDILKPLSRAFYEYRMYCSKAFGKGV